MKTVTIYSSRADIYGNRYFAFSFSDESGAEVEAKFNGGESNIRSALRLEMGLEWDQMHYREQELKIREFNRMVKSWPYAGCSSADLARYITSHITANA